MISADKLTQVGGRRQWGLNVCNSQLEIKSHLQKNLSILEVSGFKRACVSVTETRHRGRRNPSTHHNSTCTGLAPHWGDGSPGTSGNGNLFTVLLYSEEQTEVKFSSNMHKTKIAKVDAVFSNGHSSKQSGYSW